MTREPAGTVAPMEGHGLYNRASAVQGSGLLPSVADLAAAARRVPLPAGDAPVTIADYGASQGHNSLLPMRTAIAALRERAGQARPVCVVHTDLPANDFSSLFAVVAADPESYAARDPAAFPFAVGRSFYGPVLPPGSVTLGWSSWAIHWLSRSPGPIPDHFHISCSRDAATLALYERQAAADWLTFLDARGREMRPGARLVVLTMARAASGAFGYRPVLDAMQQGLERLVAEGLVTAAELACMCIPTLSRSEAALVAPFATGGRYAGLAVVQARAFAAHDAIWEEYEAAGDAHAFGARWAAFARASAFPALAGFLHGPADGPRTLAFVERLEQAVAETLAAQPQPTEMPLISLTLERLAGAAA